MNFKSIISQIAALQIVAVLTASVAMPLALYLLLRASVDDLQNGALREHAALIGGRLKHSADGWSLNLPPDLEDTFAEAYGRYSYAVVDANNRTLFSSFAAGGSLLDDEQHSPQDRYITLPRVGATLAAIVAPRSIDGLPVWIQTAENISHRDVLVDDVVSQFFTSVGWITAPILLLLLLFEIAIVRIGLKPIMAASERASRIGPTTIDMRLPEEGIPGEILPLVRAINGALDRLEGRYKSQREFTANAAHELRTPLAILGAHIDLIGDNKISHALRQDIGMMNRLVEQLLNIAEVDALVVAADAVCDLHAVCGDVASYLAPLAVTQGKSLAVAGESGAVAINGDADFVGRAIRNLVENALAHTPAGTTVTIRVTREPAIHVSDFGPGVPLAERDLIFQRFWRRDRRGRNSFGLGLSIVTRIAAAHKGWVNVGDGPGGGAVFSLHFDPEVLVLAPLPAARHSAAPGPVTAKKPSFIDALLLRL